jgi:hypothetical protein
MRASGFNCRFDAVGRAKLFDRPAKRRAAWQTFPRLPHFPVKFFLPISRTLTATVLGGIARSVHAMLASAGGRIYRERCGSGTIFWPHLRCSDNDCGDRASAREHFLRAGKQRRNCHRST